MSLDLFVNFERQSNNSIFYRQASPAPYTALVKLSSLEIDNATINENFVAQYTTNHKPETLSTFNLLTGQNISFNRRYPSVHSVQVMLSSRGDDSQSVGMYSMSAMFLNSFPTATFVAYPSSYFDSVTNKITYVKNNQYNKAPGLFFYGEGHTESIILSAAKTTATINWRIGNKTCEDITPSIWSTNQVLANTAVVSITSDLSQNIKIPIHLRLTTPDITLNGPIVYYDDVTGKKSFYSFFNSSLTVEQEERTDDLFKSHIHVRPYPHASQYTFISPFSSNQIDLPFNYTEAQFKARVAEIDNNSIFVQHLSCTQWQLHTNVDGFTKAGNWFYQTTELEKINGYVFPLSYYPVQTENIPFLKISSTGDTTITSTVSATKKIQIQQFPYDWKANQQTEILSDSATISHLPYVEVYASSYINVKHENAYFEPIRVFAKPYLELHYVIVSAENTSTTLSGDNLNNKFALTFSKLGKYALSATAVFLNKNTNETNRVTNIIPDAVNVVESYDSKSVQEYFHTTSTGLVTTETSVPRISPNEWVTENNINDILSRLYQTVSEINNHTTSYVPDNKFYAWLGNTNYRWNDLEANPENSDKTTWSDQLLVDSEIEQNNNGFPLFWNEQTCDEKVQSDSFCVQKYCLEWKWSSRKRANSEIATTWRDTKKDQALEKKWSYEACGVDAVALPCGTGRWHISTVDPEFFPLPFCGFNSDCSYVSYIEFGEYYVVARKTEIVLYKNGYEPKKLHRGGLADMLFAFVSIEAMCINDNKVYVLDSKIPKVSVYEIKNDKLTLVDSWGRYGLASNAYGFNRPRDIVIDQSKLLYVVDTGNKCIKQYSIVGKHIQTFTSNLFIEHTPISVSVDSQHNLHVLSATKVMVFDNKGNYLFEYLLSANVINPVKINTSYNREIIYISHQKGVIKYFRTGALYDSLILNMKCSNGMTVEHFNGVFQTAKRDLFVCANDKILKFSDRMKLDSTKAPISKDVYWLLDDIKIHKDEYVQSWVYLKAFHRLWDNIELIRNALYYNTSNHSENKTYVPPVYLKEDISIGQNEIVTNSVINRLSEQIWTNIQLLVKYFK